MRRKPIHAQRFHHAAKAASIASVFLPAATALSAVPVDESKLPPPAAVKIDFARDIKPIFEQSCLRCHGPEKPKSRFRLDNREDALKGGENGVAIVPGQSAKSPLIHFVAGMVEDMEMPPKGKGEPLTPAQIGLLRAWIDQDVLWETFTPPPKFEFAAAPTANWTTVNGDEKKFREHRWLREGWNGGVERFELQERLDKDAKAIVEGRALLDDYKVSLTLEKRDLGFTRFGFEQYRKYFDDSGGYYPGFHPSVFSLNRDLHLDHGRALAEVGLTLPHWPRMVLGYEYQYREGDKSTLQWGPVTSGGTTKNIFPSAKAIDERVHVIRFDLDHEIKGYRFDDNFRGEFYDFKTERLNTRAYTVGSAASRVDEIKERADYFHGANTLRVEKPLTDWWLASAGYLYSKLNSDARFSLDTLFPLGSPGFGDRWRTHELVLERETHAFNATSLWGPWQSFTLTAGVLSEWTRQEAFGRANLDLVFPPAFNHTNLVPITINSSYDRAMAEESLALRFVGIPFTTVFAEARLQQDSIGENEQQQGGAYAFLRDTDATSNLRDWRAGFSTSPWRRLSLSSHYRRYEKETDFDDVQDQSASGSSYPAFTRWRDVKTDEVEARLTTQLAAWLKTTFSYKLVSSDYRTATDPVSAFASGDVSPGGRLEAAKYDAHIYSLNATLTPWRRLYLSGTFSYQDTRMAAFDNGSASVVPYRGDVFSVLASANYAVSQNTDLTATYSFSWADYAQNNYTEGPPVGLHYQQHGLTAGISRRLTANISTRLQYGFYYYEEPSSGGANNYTAHAVLATLVVRMP
jgi:mono/diheme cytochrome c family protein